MYNNLGTDKIQSIEQESTESAWGAAKSMHSLSRPTGFHSAACSRQADQ